MQPPGINPSQCSKKLVAKVFHGIDLYEECAMKEVYVEGLELALSKRLREYYGAKKEATLFHHTFRATSLLRLQDRVI